MNHETAVKLLITVLIFLSLFTQSCNCKYTPTYGGQARMIYGHSDESKWTGFNKHNPYYVKAKKPAKSHNYYSN